MSGRVVTPGVRSENRGGAARRYWLLLAALVLGYFGTFALYPNSFFSLGINHYDAWFLDTFALLASNDALARGLDPYAPNPLDYLHRPHVYSHWWLHLRDLGLTRADVGWLGALLVAAFFVAALSRLRPRTPAQILGFAAILCASPVVLAVDRANNDLAIFVLLAPVVPCLLSTRRGVRWLAPFLVAIAAALKYYPAAGALVLLAGADRVELRRRLFLVAALFAAAAITTLPDLLAHPALVPAPVGLLSFGAGAFFQQFGWVGWAPNLCCALAGAVIVAVAWRSRWLVTWEPSESQRSAWWSFVLGASLLAGCFFTGLNFGYRWIFALWLAPLLWLLPSDTSAPISVRRLARATRALLLVVLWWDPVCCFGLNRLVGELPAPEVMSYARECFVVEQPLVWALFALLLVFLVRFVRGAAEEAAGKK